ncbi:alkaline phosphatase [Aliiglaciecola sp. 3_MG-2023]|uniref:alkaline phosphatase n=1 Tax=Aliiglaciecola sp. 3_MG-2023 TaxID=3062644 RepID=UPI0026E401BA|nr:alkaline phosphatase [Aliiglaciecola sp. 3_MG-2023]MDO6694710.1 alkaline phosphatase [Aliiglaciecola sp. 3_MG-2023]
MNLFKLSMISIAIAGLSACTLDGDDGANGTDGSNGSNGLNSLTLQTQLSSGNENCPVGGVQIDSGIDANGDGALSTDEITATNFVCSPGSNALSSTELLTSLNNDWFVTGAVEVEENKTVWQQATSSDSAQTIEQLRGKAKNVILFVGDGMGISTVTASRILAGQLNGNDGEENQLSFERFPFSGLSKTYNVDAQTPDSAGTMTAMMSGVKTDVGVIGVDEAIERGDCSTVSGNELVTALELAEISGKSTGIISTARITHATPAATYAKSADRNWEDISDMSTEAAEAGCIDIADQLVNFETNLEDRYEGLDIDGIEVVMGGGRRHFLPNDASFNSPDAVSGVEGDRTDGRDLTAEWKANYPAGTYVYDQSGFDVIDTENTPQLFGLFNESHMQYEADRGNDIAGEPSIVEMTETAIKVLDNNDNGFFLMVESGRIDHGHHAGSAYNALTDTIAFAEAVAKADELTSDEDTLIIVTADHGHVFTIAGYPKRGNPILGKVVNVGADEPATAADGMPYTTLGYTNGLGFQNLGDETDADAAYGFANAAGRHDLTDVDTTASGYHQEALIPLGSETHSGEDVGIHAKGPGAWLVNGTNEQSVIFHVMDYAADLVETANEVVQ